MYKVCLVDSDNVGAKYLLKLFDFSKYNEVLFIGNTIPKGINDYTFIKSNKCISQKIYF